MRTMWIAAAALGGLLLTDSRAAGSCVVRAGPTVMPDGEGVARSAQVRVRMPRRWAEHVGDGRVTLRPVGPEGTVMGPVEVREQLFDWGREAMLVLTPRAPLAAYTAYQVMFAAEGDRAEELTRFITGAGRDVDPPAWSGAFEQVSYQPEREDERDLSVIVAAVRDPDTLVDDQSSIMMWGLWPARRRFDPAAPPLALFEADATIRFGPGAGEHRVDLDHAAALDGDGDPARLSLHLAPIDESGNVGTPARITIGRANAARPE